MFCKLLQRLVFFCSRSVADAVCTQMANRQPDALCARSFVSVSDEMLHVHPQVRFAWATNRRVFKATMGGQKIELPLRCTWILEKREAGWVIIHFHKSAGMAD